MSKFAYIPTDPGEIEHVLDLLRRDLDPENQRAIRRAEMRRYDIAPRLRDALIEKIAPQVPEWERRDWSDFAHLTANTRYADWVRAAAVAICNLHYLQAISDRRVEHGTDPEDISFDWLPEWESLRAAMIEVALSLAFSELIDEEKRRKRAEEHAAALGEAAEQAKVFRSGRRKGALASHTEYLRDMILDHPEMTTKQIAKLVRDRRNEEGNPFDVDGDEDILRDTGDPYKLEAAIENVRKRYVNRSDSAS